MEYLYLIALAPMKIEGMSAVEFQARGIALLLTGCILLCMLLIEGMAVFSIVRKRRKGA